MKKNYQQVTIEIINLKKQDVILASVFLGTGDNVITDDYDELS